MVSGSGGTATGERRVEEREVSIRVWWVRCVERESWEVLSLATGSVPVYILSTLWKCTGIQTYRVAPLSTPA